MECALPILHPGWTVPPRLANLSQSLGQTLWVFLNAAPAANSHQAAVLPAHLELISQAHLPAAQRFVVSPRAGITYCGSHIMTVPSSLPGLPMSLACLHPEGFFAYTCPWENQYISMPYGGKKSHLLLMLRSELCLGRGLHFQLCPLSSFSSIGNCQNHLYIFVLTFLR